LKRTDFQQFYVLPENIRADTFSLFGEEFRHAIKVLRKKKGDGLAAIDGRGQLYHGIIECIKRDSVQVSITKIDKDVGEPRIKLTIAQAVPKGQHFDLVVEKGTEIGVAAFQPILAERCLIDPSSRVERWQHKALAAAKQCGRSRCPVVHAPCEFTTIMQDNAFDIALIAHERIEPAAREIFKNVRNHTNIVVFIGPEGGFTEKEVQHAVKMGAFPISLGIRRLRSETAAIIAATKILGALGELGDT